MRAGWPRVLTLNREGADRRRDRLLTGIATRAGMDRDEYPPAVGARVRARRRGVRPVLGEPLARLVLGLKLRRYCDGTRFRYVFY